MKKQVLYIHLFYDNTLSVRAFSERIGLPTGGKDTTAVGFVSPATPDTFVVKLSRSVKTTWFSVT